MHWIDIELATFIGSEFLSISGLTDKARFAAAFQRYGNRLYSKSQKIIGVDWTGHICFEYANNT